MKYDIDNLTKNIEAIATYDKLNETWGSYKGRYDENQIRVMNTLNNTLLQTVDLEEYASLKKRFNQGTITNEEYSKFLFDMGMDPNTVRDLFLREFPVQIDIGVLDVLLSNGAKSGVLIPGASELISDSKDLITVINTAGGLVNIQNMTDFEAETYLKTSIKDATGKLVATVERKTGEIRNAKDELVGTITPANEIVSATKKVVVDPSGSLINTRTGQKLENSPILSGTNTNVTGRNSTTAADIATGNNRTDPLVSTGITSPNTSATTRFIPGVGEDSTNWNPSQDIKKYLKKLDFHYETTFGAALDTDLCSKFTDPFGKISSLMALSNKQLGFDLYKQILDASEEIVVKSPSGYGRYDSLIKDTLDLVDDLKEKNLLKIESITDTIQNFISETNVGAARTVYFFGKKNRQITYFFSDINIEYIKRKIANVANSNRLQFESGEVFNLVLNLILLKLCNISAYVEFTFDRQVEEYKTSVDRFIDTFYAQETKSMLVSVEAINAGAVRVNPRDRITDSTMHSITHNANADEERLVNEDDNIQIFPMKHISIPMTEEEKTMILTLTEDGNDYFQFQDSVKEMGYFAREMYLRGGDGIEDHEKQWNPAQNYYEAGWKMIVEKNPIVYAFISRIAKRLQEEGELSGPLMLNSCYRSAYYNRVYLRGFLGLEAGWNSPHMSAMAIDISTNGLSNLGTAKLIQFASQEGFNRISCYDTFIHVDIQDGAYRGDWTKNYRNDANIKQAMALHLTRQHNEGRKA